MGDLKARYGMFGFERRGPGGVSGAEGTAVRGAHSGQQRPACVELFRVEEVDSQSPLLPHPFEGTQDRLNLPQQTGEDAREAHRLSWSLNSYAIAAT